MTWFKIESIRYGGFAMTAGELYCKASDRCGYDMPRKFLEKIVRLVTGESDREYLYLMAESGASMLVLSAGRCRIHLDVYDLKADCDALPAVEREAYSLLGDCYANLAVTIPEAVDDLVTEFSLYENGNGKALYESHWMPFPQEPFDALKSIAFQIEEEMEGSLEMLCTTYLKPEDVMHSE